MTNVRNHGRKRRKAPSGPWSQGPAGPAVTVYSKAEPFPRSRALIANAIADVLLDAYPPTRTPYKERKHATEREVFITIGPDCPWNPTPGIRQSLIFPSVRAAHAAGFTYVR